MKLSVEWLRELVDLPESVEQLCEDLTMLGLEVEAVEEVGLGFPGIVVGHVLEHAAHPNADRLSLCRVTTGDQEFPVVCGAPNVRQGLKVAFATPGATLPDGLTIKKAKIRGEVSLGMICSERELGLGEGHEGILELSEELEPGRDIDELFGWKDTCIEIEVTPNRPDWLSHLGVARELAARYGKPVRVPELGPQLETVEEDEGYRAVCEDREGCPRYTGLLVHGLREAETPEWMKRRLLAIGQRPINAVVDCSNYVLHECGQPNHAFDLARLSGKTITIRRAEKKERCTTLDGQERELNEAHLVIADESGAIALAGLMGGEATEVSADTSDLLLEVASFDPGTVRRMRRSLGMSTDASYRFERGVDPDLPEWTQRRLARLLVECCGGRANTRMFQGVGTPRARRSRFFVRVSQVHRVLGVVLGLDEMLEMMRRLEIPAQRGEQNGEPGFWVDPPSFRSDLVEEVDIVEEVARLHGYDRIPVRERAPMLRPAERSAAERLRAHLREHLAAAGFHELAGSSFMHAADPDRLALDAQDPRRRSVEVLNPLVADEGHLKTHSLPECLRIVDRNLRHGWTRPIRLFELDRCFVSRGEGELPEEPESLLLIWAGPAEEPHHSREPRGVDPADARGDLEVLLERLALGSVTVVPDRGEAFEMPSASGRVECEGRELGRVGMLHPRVLRSYDLEGPIAWASLRLDALESALPSGASYREIPVYPPVRRDLSLVVPAGVRYGELAGLLRRVGADLLEELDVFDLYEGPGIPEGSRAVGVRLVLRSAKGTLKDKRVDALVTKMLQELEASLDVRLRAG